MGGRSGQPVPEGGRRMSDEELFALPVEADTYQISYQKEQNDEH